MASIGIKQKVLEAVRQLPPDATVEDAIERLYFLANVEFGVAQTDAGERLPHEAVRKRLLKRHASSGPSRRSKTSKPG